MSDYEESAEAAARKFATQLEEAIVTISRLTAERDQLHAERDQARAAIIAYGKGVDFDWDVLGKIDEQEKTIDQLRAELAAATAVVERLRTATSDCGYDCRQGDVMEARRCAAALASGEGK